MQEAHRERLHFDQALDLATAAEREAFLRQACGDDGALLQRLQELLAAHEVTSGFLPKAPRRTIAVMPEELPEELPGALIGRYKILERVGDGGCGVVYVAEQTEPVRRRVALKVNKLDLDTKSAARAATVVRWPKGRRILVGAFSSRHSAAGCCGDMQRDRAPAGR